GEMFDVIARHVPGPPGIESPMLWGTEEHLSQLFGAAVADARSTRRTFTLRFTSPEDFVADYRSFYGPILKAFAALDEAGQAALAADLARLAQRWDRNGGGSIAIPATYLGSILILRPGGAAASIRLGGRAGGEDGRPLPRDGATGEPGPMQAARPGQAGRSRLRVLG